MAEDATRPMLWPLLQRSKPAPAAPRPKSLGGMSEEDRAGFRAHLIDAGYDEATADMMVDEQDKAMGGELAPFEDISHRPGGTAIRTLLPMLLAGGGSIVGRAAPEIAEASIGATRFGKALGLANKLRRIPLPIRAGVGAGTGDALGAMGTGTPPKEAARRGLWTALLGTTIEGGSNALARAGAGMSGVADESVEAALGAKPAPGSTGLKRFMSRIGPFTSGRITRIPKFYRGAPSVKEEDRLIDLLRTRAHARPPGMEEAEAAMAARKGPVSAFPVRQAISKQMRLRTQEDVPTPADVTASESLDRLRQLLPRKAVKRGARPQQPGTGEFADVTKLQNYLRRLRRPIAEKIGEPTPQLTAQDLKAIQADVRAYRDKLLGGPDSPGAKAFAKVHSRLDEVEPLMDDLEDAGGAQRTSAEGYLKTAPTNMEKMRRIRAVDPDLADEVEELYHKRQWTNTPTGWHRIGVIGRGPAKGFAMAARPAGTATAMITSYLQAVEAQKRAREALANP